MMTEPRVQAISFDLFNTVVHLEPDRDEVQLRILERHGIAAERRAIQAALVYLDGANTPMRFARSSDPEAEREAWGHYERDLLARAGIDVDQEHAERIALECLAMKQRFALFDDAEPAIRAVRSAGLRTVLVSNAETPLERLVPELDAGALFDAVVTSGDVGVAKPDRRIFEAAAERVGVPLAAVLHVGDQLEGDVYGAQRAGMRGVLLDPHGVVEAPPGILRIANLEELLRLLDVGQQRRR